MTIRRPSGPLLAIITTALAAIGWTWRWHDLVGHEASSNLDASPGWFESFVVALIATALIGLLAGLAALVSGGRHPWWRSLLAAGVTGAVGLVIVVAGDDVIHGGALRLGFALTVTFALAVLLVARPANRDLAELALVGAIWLVGFVLWWNDAGNIRPGELVWDSSDQVTYLRITGQLVQLNFLHVPYLLGLPVMLGPAVLAAGGFPATPADVDAANVVNLVLLPGTLLIGMPVTVLLIARAAVEGTGVGRRLMTLGASAAATVAIVFTYAIARPDFLSAREAGLVARRIVGAVYAPESLSMAYLAGLLLVVAASTDRTRRWSPAVLGVATAVAVMVREYNAMLALLFVLVLLTIPHRRRDAIVTGAIAAAAFLPQVLHWHLVYDSLFFPNRLVLWEDSGRAARWKPIVEERYGWVPPGDPPQISPRYVSTNLSDWLSNYGLVLAVITGLGALLLVVRRPQWRLWGFSLAVVWGTVLFDSGYINIEVTYRYNAIVLPAVAVLAASAVLLVFPRHAGADAPVDATAEPGEPGPIDSPPTRPVLA